jgi:hypothetical protein
MSDPDACAALRIGWCCAMPEYSDAAVPAAVACVSACASIGHRIQCGPEFLLGLEVDFWENGAVPKVLDSRDVVKGTLRAAGMEPAG